ncbi:CHAT domain-containing protein [Actinomadura rubrisoli]|uniref:CHAT domain-containing protein n=1 Tax=Actinomadura rubrisoli TaxID=2530368 RepID=A0A4R5B1N2_9ACTN|nr:CHAT domain-containing protein [Actinomadura rubrisoli]TDD79531.1 CHAT domain-containing protein [Actinomadura rubrisoli]
MEQTDPAREALRLAEGDPRRAVGYASALARRAHAEGDAALESVAERALGDAKLYLEDVDTALAHLRSALRLGIRAGSSGLATEARIRLAFALNVRGRPRQAMREIRTALRDASGVTRARATAQRGAIVHHLGRLDEAYADYRTAIPALRRAGDELWLQRMLSNRAVLHGNRREFSAAEADLGEAETLCRRLGLELSLGFVHQNLGWISTMRGEVPAALHYLRMAERRFRELGSQLGEVLLDRARLLLSVNVTGEARQAAEEAVGHFARERRQIGLPEARLVLVGAAALEGDHARAVEEARRAVVEFRRQERPEWAVLARFAVLFSQLAGGRPPRTALGRLERVADELAAAGWPVEALEARRFAGRLALERGMAERGRRQLAELARARARGPADLRVRAWNAEALIRLSRGDRRGATSAVRAGLRVLDEHRTTLGATDLRAHASGLRADLAALGLRIAAESGRPGRVLEWAEQGRASHLLMRPVRPPADKWLADAFTELRVTAGAIADLGGARGTAAPRARLVQRQLVLEREIRDYCRLRRGDGPAWAAEPASVRALAAELGGTALVEFVLLDGALHVVTVVDGRARLRRLGAPGDVRDLVDRIPFALHRIVRQHVSPQSRSAAELMLRDTAERLDVLLLGPLRDELAGRPLVLVPTGPLQSLPWSILPSCAGRPVTVSPSATLWLAGRTQCPPFAPPPGAACGPALVAAGPDLRWADAETRAVARIHGAAPLTGPAATVGAVLEAFNGARLVHLAAHGRIHPTNPLFSSLRFADGPLTVYDLETLERAPRLVILAACDSGRSIVQRGDELLGLSATLLALGTRQVIASVMPVPDAETAPLMIAFHRRLAAGSSAAEALALAQRELSGRDAAARAAAAGFVFMGTDA